MVIIGYVISLISVYFVQSFGGHQRNKCFSLLPRHWDIVVLLCSLGIVLNIFLFSLHCSDKVI